MLHDDVPPPAINITSVTLNLTATEANVAVKLRSDFGANAGNVKLMANDPNVPNRKSSLQFTLTNNGGPDGKAWYVEVEGQELLNLCLKQLMGGTENPGPGQIYDHEFTIAFGEPSGAAETLTWWNFNVTGRIYGVHLGTPEAAIEVDIAHMLGIGNSSIQNMSVW